VAILEAMADALPVNSTRHAGIPDAVVDSCTGYLVDQGDSRTIVQWTKVLPHQLVCADKEAKQPTRSNEQ
jgi:hypothetical protein